MAWRAPRPCGWPRCGDLAPRGKRYCVPHQARHEARRYAWQAARDADRGTAAQRGYGYGWQQLRARILKRDGTCRACRRAPSRHVDHVVPRALGGTDHEANLQGLCPRCHSRKTLAEGGRAAREKKSRPRG